MVCAPAKGNEAIFAVVSMTAGSKKRDTEASVTTTTHTPFQKKKKVTA